MTADTTVDTGLKRRFEAGDGLRGLAVLCVLLAHAGRTTGALNPDPGFLTYFAGDGHVFRGMQLCIYMFFVLSGYLIARPFTYALIEGRKLPSINRYARSRLLRIVPAFWLFFTLTLIIDGARGSSLREILAAYGFAQTYDFSLAANLLRQAWTLDVEMGFYVTLPLGALLYARLLPRLSTRVSRTAWLLAGVGVMAVASMALRIVWDNPAFESTFPEFLVAFTPGIALAVIEPHVVPRVLGSKRARRVASVVFALGFVVFFARFIPREAVPWELTAWGVPMGGLMVGGALLREWTGAPGFGAFTHRVSAWFGERSYGIYLVHLLVLRHITSVIEEFANPWIGFMVVFVLLVALSSLAAAISWRFLEVPAMKLGKRGRSRPAVPEPARAG
jgi:peptidoglycan/LPS O-acetylase OafA/YrhL